MNKITSLKTSHLSQKQTTEAPVCAPEKTKENTAVSSVKVASTAKQITPSVSTNPVNQNITPKNLSTREVKNQQTPSANENLAVSNVNSEHKKTELHFSDLDFNKFVFQDSGRKFVSASGSGDNRCGFNAMACQAIDKQLTGQLLREKLKVSPGTMFDVNDPARGIARAANILQQPVVALHCPGQGKIKAFYFSVPHAESLFFVETNHDNLQVSFREWAAEFKTYVDFETLANLIWPSGSFRDPSSTLCDALSALLKNPRTVVILNAAQGDQNGNVNGGHFNAAAHSQLDAVRLGENSANK
ncbi:MAG: hypothetical protein LBI81_00420 [Puniceicoccales bacterium]|nr:hypothetical protein [Puniceicoccales bacterium]